MTFNFKEFNTTNLIAVLALLVGSAGLLLNLSDRWRKRKRIRALDALVFYLALDSQAGLCMDLTLENCSSIPVSVSHARISLDKRQWYDFALCPPIQDDSRFDPLLRLSPSDLASKLPAILPPYSAQRMTLWFHDRPSHELIDRFLRVFPDMRPASNSCKFYSTQRCKSERRLVVFLSLYSCGQQVRTRLVIRDRNIVG